MVMIETHIRNYCERKWEQVAGNLCHPGIRAKFEQNPLVLNTLLTKTGDKCIVECASDRLWGTGLPLSDPDCLNRSKWINQGILGQILEDIRNEFKDANRHHSQYAVSPPQPVANAVPTPIITAAISAANQSITHAHHEEAVASGAALGPPDSTAPASHTSGPESTNNPPGKDMEVT